MLECEEMLFEQLITQVCSGETEEPDRQAICVYGKSGRMAAEPREHPRIPPELVYQLMKNVDGVAVLSPGAQRGPA